MAREFHGIDEAGYGPLLGPLVVGRSDFEVLGEGSEATARSRAPTWIGDSKRILAGSGGRERLERAVLGCLASLGRPWTSLGRLVRPLAPGGAFSELPWYEALDGTLLPLWTSAEKVDETARAIEGGDLFGSSRRLTGLTARVLPESSYNDLVRATGNKHETLIQEVMDLIDEAWTPDVEHVFAVDRLGGRKRYGSKLAFAFPFQPLEVCEETARISRYRVQGKGSSAEIFFRVHGEDHHPECALASMMAKYLREALMHGFNVYWSSRAPGILPTAGYYEDGRRFLDDLTARGLLDDATRRALVRLR